MRFSLLYKQITVCCFPLLQSSHVGRTLAKLFKLVWLKSMAMMKNPLGVIGSLFADDAVHFTKRVLSVCTWGNVHSDNKNGREHPQQIERLTLHNHKIHQ